MGTVRGFFTVWEECGEDQVGERTLSRVGALFKDGGALSLLLFAEEVYAGTSRALFLLGSILGVVTFTGAAKITFYDTMALL